MKAFFETYKQAFEGHEEWLNTTLIQSWKSINRNQQESELSADIFKRLELIALIDKYQAYQYLNDQWQIISADLEMMQTEGFTATKQVDPNIVIRKKDGKDVEVQEGWKGRVLPFELVQQTYLSEDLLALEKQEKKFAEVTSQLEEIIESFTEEEKDSPIFNDKNDAFVKTELTKALKEIYADVDSDEIRTLNQYIALLDNRAKKPEKLAFVEAHVEVSWQKIVANKDGTYGKAKVNTYLQKLREAFEFDPETYEGKIVVANRLLNEQTELKEDTKEKTIALHLKTKNTIEGLADEEVKEILHLKWIAPLSHALAAMPSNIIAQLTNKVQALADKYSVTYSQVAKEIKTTERELSDMIGELTGNEFDMQGLSELTCLLIGGQNDR